MNKNKQKISSNDDKFSKLFGFKLSSLSNWSSFIELMNRPEDPSSLAVFRILFGCLMMIDIPNERGMADADIEYGKHYDNCRFPLFDSLKPFRAHTMIFIYSVMLMGAIGITLGFKYRLSCLCFMLPYWYLFALDKTTWNNHSYLYGIIGFQLLLVDANRYLSIDGLFNKQIHNVHVPLWNYTLIRTQIFFVYFIAGLKKLDFDWITGYSMSNLASHWVFDPFK
jgi:vitamin K-dependent gamma-carboxylase